MTASANVGGSGSSPADNIDSFSAPAEARIDTGDTSAVVRAVVSVAGGGSQGGLLRRGSVTDITNE